MIAAQTETQTRTPEPRTAASDVLAAVAKAREAFDSGRTRPLAWRKAQLDAIARMIGETEADILAALAADVGKPPFEAYRRRARRHASRSRVPREQHRDWMRPSAFRRR